MKKLFLILITLNMTSLPVDYPADAPGEKAVWERLYDTSKKKCDYRRCNQDKGKTVSVPQQERFTGLEY